MEISTVDINPKHIRISKRTIAKLMGVDPENIPEPYNEIIKRELLESLNYIDVRGGVAVSSDIVIYPEGTFSFANVKFNAGKKIVDFLAGSDKLVFFVCTVGEEVTRRSRQNMNNGDMLVGYIIDTIGSLFIEGAVDILLERLKTEYGKKGLKVTNRYSPGYCNWKTNDQRELFGLFPEGFCGIRLSESGLMIPLKSLSGVIGIGKEVVFKKYECRNCNIINCIHREINSTTLI